MTGDRSCGHTMPPVILDLSRLLSRVRHHTPSGVDRVEMAYARGLLERFGDHLDFAAVHPFGRYGRLPRDNALRCTRSRVRPNIASVSRSLSCVMNHSGN